MLRMFSIVPIFLLTIATAAMSADLNDIYRPPGQEYPQIIQDFDYATIEAIETLYIEMTAGR